MAKRPQRWRLIVGWLLTLAIVAFAILDLGSSEEVGLPPPADEGESPIGLRITALSENDVNPGDALVVKYAGASAGTPVEARLAHRSGEIVAREPGSLVVRIPPDLPAGKVAVRILQGPDRSKSWDLHVREPHYKKLLGRMLGGLALFVLGLTMLALGLRGLAGDRVRSLLGKVTGSRPRATLVGALVGFGTQLTSSSAALTVSLVESRMLRATAANAVLVGAQLGATITGALLPAGLSTDSLLMIAVGVVWSRLAITRRGTAAANLVLGAGLMLYGLHLLQTSLAPLVGSPKLLPYLDHLRTPGTGALVECALTGTVLALVLQGPGPAYILIVGLSQTTTLPLENAFAITAGAQLGASLGIALITFTGSRTRRLALPHLAFGLAACIALVATASLWTSIATHLAPESVEYGHGVIRARVAAQLAIALVAGEIVVALLWLLVLPRVIARGDVARPLAADATPLGRQLAEVVDELRAPLAIALETATTGERRRSAEAETALSAARTALEGRYRGLAETADERDARALVSALQLLGSIEQAVHVSELCVERGVQISPELAASLREMHEVASESFDALLGALLEDRTPDLEDAGAREIRMNSLEARTRESAVVRRRARRESTSSLQIGVAELVNAFESVGNHLFRLAKALAEGE